MFGFGKNNKGPAAPNEAPDMTGVRPGSKEEIDRYNDWKREKVAAEVGRRGTELAELEAAGGEDRVVNHNDSLRIHSGEHPVVVVDESSEQVISVSHPGNET